MTLMMMVMTMIGRPKWCKYQRVMAARLMVVVSEFVKTAVDRDGVCRDFEPVWQWSEKKSRAKRSSRSEGARAEEKHQTTTKRMNMYIHNFFIDTLRALKTMLNYITHQYLSSLCIFGMKMKTLKGGERKDFVGRRKQSINCYTIRLRA